MITQSEAAGPGMSVLPQRIYAGSGYIFHAG